MVFILSVFSLFYCFALSKAQEKEKTMKNATVNTINANTVAAAIVRANKAKRVSLNRVDKALGKGKDGKYRMNGNTYDNKTDICTALQVNVCTINRRVGEIGMDIEEATDFPRFAVFGAGNDRPIIPNPPHDAATEAYWPIPTSPLRWAQSKRFGYDCNSKKWVDPIIRTTGAKPRKLRYDSFSQMCAVHKRHTDFVRYGIELGLTLKEALTIPYNIPDERGMEIVDPVTQKKFTAFNMNEAIKKVLDARGLSDRRSSVNSRAIWKHMILDGDTFETALFWVIAGIGPKKTYKARYIGAEYGCVIFRDGQYVSTYWVDPNSGRRFGSFPKMCKCYMTTPARVETALKKGMALGTALIKTGLKPARGAKEVL